MSSKKPFSASETSEAEVAGADSRSSVTTKVPHDVSNVSVHVCSGSSLSVGAVSPPSPRASGASTLAHSAPEDVVTGVVVSGAAASSSPPQPARSSAGTATKAATAVRIRRRVVDERRAAPVLLAA